MSSDERTERIYTSEDVAREAGVSQSTVSRVFTSGTNVSEKKRKRVLEVAKRLNYQPNAHARSLITRKAKIIGIVMRDIRNPFYSAVLEIFYNRLSVRGYHIIFVKSENEEIQENEIVQLLEYNVEGVIVSDALLSPEAAERFKRNGTVVILFNRYTEDAENSAVFCDNYLAAKQIANYLVEMGHKSFAFISGPPDTSITIDRLKGFREVLEERDIWDLIISSGNDTYESGFRSAQELMVNHKSIDCIFCGNDIIALGAMDAIRVIGLRIPEDVSVVGFDNIRMSAWPSYSLTTWEQPLEEMMDSMVEILFQEINHKTTTHKTIMMKGHLVVRTSVKSKYKT
jgi:DNA-binding LacI/PurR family transcriptional regulator